MERREEIERKRRSGEKKEEREEGAGGKESKRERGKVNQATRLHYGSS